MTDVRVKLPGPLVWELWKRAEQADMSVADVILDALTRQPVVRVDPHAEVRRQVVALVESGADDGAIAVSLGRTRSYVAEVRRRAGLKANKRK